MKKSRLSKEQIVGVLHEQEGLGRSGEAVRMTVSRVYKRFNLRLVRSDEAAFVRVPDPSLRDCISD